MTTQILHETQHPFLLKPNSEECNDEMYEQLCRAIEGLGGIRVQDLFAFESAHKRAAAADTLGDRFGMRYFKLV